MPQKKKSVPQPTSLTSDEAQNELLNLQVFARSNGTAYQRNISNPRLAPLAEFQTLTQTLYSVKDKVPEIAKALGVEIPRVELDLVYSYYQG